MPEGSGVHAHPATTVPCVAALTIQDKEANPFQSGNHCASIQAAGERQADNARPQCTGNDSHTSYMLREQAETCCKGATNPACNTMVDCLDSDDGLAAGINGLLVSQSLQPQSSRFNDLSRPKLPYVTERSLYYAGATLQGAPTRNAPQARHRSQTSVDKPSDAIEILKP